MSIELPSREVLLLLLRYEPKTGALYWRKRPSGLFEDGGHNAAHNRDKWNARWAGEEAFTAVKSGGYRHGAIHGVTYASHRVIWKMVTGEDPIDIDHIDGDRGNNRWDNLRSVSRSVNLKNAARARDNRSGVTGVRWNGRGKWQAFITVNYKLICLGSFEDFADAVTARKEAEQLQGFYPAHGREPRRDKG